MAISPRTIWASLSPTKLRRGTRWFGLTLVASQTWLTQPCTLLVAFRSVSGNGWQFPAELDHVAITVLPVVEKIEIGNDLIEVCGRLSLIRRRWSCGLHNWNIGGIAKVCEA